MIHRFPSVMIKRRPRLLDRLLQRFSQWRLAQQQLFLSLLLTILLMLVAGAWIRHTEEQHSRELFLATLNEKMAAIKGNSLNALVNQDRASLREILEDAGYAEANILAVAVVGHNNQPFAAWQRQPQPAGAHPETLVSAVHFGNEEIASLAVTWDVAHYLKNLGSHTGNLYVILAFLLLTLSVGLIFLNRWLVIQPLRIIHDSLHSARPSELTMSIASRELQRLADAVMTSLTLRQESLRSELRYRGLFENMSSACMVLSARDQYFCIEDMNDSCRNMPALQIGKRAVTHLSQILTPKETPELFAALRHLEALRLNCHLGEIALTRQGNLYWLDCHIFTLNAGEAVLILEDITEHKCSQSLRRAKEAAEQANELKTTFLASVSHEIRTPLNGVLSMVELLRGTHLSNKQRHWVDAIRGSGQLLLSTINDILDFSRIEAGRLHLEEIHFSLGEVISNLLNATAQRAYAKGLEMTLHQGSQLPDQLIGDPFRIQQILVNLVGNAIKFTEHGTVEILLEKREIPGDRLVLCVSVRDTGVGIAPELIERIFMPFEQGSISPTMFSEGTGLGLAISKRLVDAMQGEIKVESSLGSGSLFRIEVPVGQAKNPERAGWLLADQWTQCTALVCIQHASVRQSIIGTLRGFGFKAQLIATSADILAWSADNRTQKHTCLVVMDDQQVGDDLLKTAQQMKACGAIPDYFMLHVVNMFKLDKGELERLDSQANTAYVGKPVHASALFDALQILFGISGKRPRSSAKMGDLSWEMLIQRLQVREHLSGARILLVEDNLVNQDVTVEALSMAGIEVQIAANGQEAVDLLAIGDSYDAVLMDLQMPVMDGFKATEIIRKTHGMDTLPIIAMTAGVLFRDRQRSLEVGMNDHVGKPINMQSLLRTLLKWVKPAHPRHYEAHAANHDTDLGAAAFNADLDWANLELPGLKVFKGLNRLGGSHKLYFKLLKSFTKAHAASAAEILACLANRDFKTLHRLAHTLKGVATTLGADELHSCAAALEKACPAAGYDAIRAAAEPLIVRLNEMMSSVSTLHQRARSTDAPPPVATLAAPRALLSPALHQEMHDLLQRSDTRIQEVCAASSAVLAAWFASPEEHERFSEDIENYDFEEALQLFLKQPSVEHGA
jgi:two-component system, sensor histidine kinase and response regulator